MDFSDGLEGESKDKQSEDRDDTKSTFREKTDEENLPEGFKNTHPHLSKSLVPFIRRRDCVAFQLLTTDYAKLVAARKIRLFMSPNFPEFFETKVSFNEFKKKNKSRKIMLIALTLSNKNKSTKNKQTKN
ncbi:hypothetical protein BpHYR1_027709 [Brachionus plicatilis]|uniref:Uncharacterized protein n=1 Tax=Brachionus plicatilis TaxID=10195 RepID=A0A3M7Q7B8_BRAPC|nr:hypothetical protein BpHYR1_027709 [Brachionus plicatilis]